ncbi:MAG: DUF1573 domain-containing protein [Bacteroidales bacterium]|nr:DUF1573 domain-containing protein [Bacteroidales bacterium]MDD3201817.1 DUF1573 domain-containing protein [Bacteroidales bacterium]
MRRVVSIVLAVCFSLSYGVLYAQEEQQTSDWHKVIKLDKTIHDFGDVLIADGALKCTFNITNISSAPIVIHNIISSCGCTTPQWTKEPIRPNESGTIEVVYSNDQGPYPFDKNLTVYISSISRPVVLRIRGIAHEEKKDVTELYTLKIGNLGMRKTTLPLGYIDQGESKSDGIDIANLTKSPMKVESTERSQGLLINVTPNPIPPKSIAKLTYTVNTQLMEQKSWGKAYWTAKLIIDGKKYDDIIRVQGVIKDNFTNLTKAQVASAAVPASSKSYFEFGEVKQGKVVENTFYIKNKGKDNLIIHKVESEQKGVTLLSKCPVTVKPGEQGAIRIKFDTSACEGEVINILTLITNSPSKPMMNLFITGNVVK